MKMWYHYCEVGKTLPFLNRQVFAALESESILRLGLDIQVGFHSGSVEVSIPCLTVTLGYGTPMSERRVP